MRKAAAASSAHQFITQNDTAIQISIKTFKGRYEYEAPLDGTEIKYIDSDKDNVTSTTTLSEDKQSITEQMIKGKDKKQYTSTRYMENNEMRLKITNKNATYCIRILKRCSQ